jgi:hypothetical protein
MIFYFILLSSRNLFLYHQDGKSWNLPLPHDDPLQPLYRGPPLPLSVLESAGIAPGSDGTYEDSDPNLMAQTCRQMAGWKLASNGINVSCKKISMLCVCFNFSRSLQIHHLFFVFAFFIC